MVLDRAAQLLQSLAARATLQMGVAKPVEELFDVAMLVARVRSHARAPRKCAERGVEDLLLERRVHRQAIDQSADQLMTIRLVGFLLELLEERLDLGMLR